MPASVTVLRGLDGCSVADDLRLSLRVEKLDSGFGLEAACFAEDCTLFARLDGGSNADDLRFSFRMELLDSGIGVEPDCFAALGSG